MKRINSADKRALRRWLRDKYRECCAYCGKQVGDRGTVDHYMPQVMGGTNARENLRWACSPCNNAKGDMLPEDWEQRAPVLIERPETRYEAKVRLLTSTARREVAHG